MFIGAPRAVLWRISDPPVGEKPSTRPIGNAREPCARTVSCQYCAIHVLPTPRETVVTTVVRIYGLGALSLGLIGFAFADFALQWQPVSDALPWRQSLAYASAAILVIGGGALLLRRSQAAGAAILAIVYALWVAALHGPRIVAHPTSIVAWLGLCEIFALACGGLIAFASMAAPSDRRFTDRAGGRLA